MLLLTTESETGVSIEIGLSVFNLWRLYVWESWVSIDLLTGFVLRLPIILQSNEKFFSRDSPTQS